MFKETKAIATKFVDSLAAPITSFDNTIQANPDLLLPLAVIHASVVAVSIAGTVAVIRGHQQVKIAKEQTKQVKLRAFIEGPGKHHPGCHHGYCKHHHSAEARPQAHVGARRPHHHAPATPEA